MEANNSGKGLHSDCAQVGGLVLRRNLDFTRALLSKLGWVITIERVAEWSIWLYLKGKKICMPLNQN